MCVYCVYVCEMCVCVPKPHSWLFFPVRSKHKFLDLVIPSLDNPVLSTRRIIPESLRRTSSQVVYDNRKSKETSAMVEMTFFHKNCQPIARTNFWDIHSGYKENTHDFYSSDAFNLFLYFISYIYMEWRPYTWVWCLWRCEEGTGSPRARVTRSLSCMLGMYLGPLQKEHRLLTAKSSLRAPQAMFLI